MNKPVWDTNSYFGQLHLHADHSVAIGVHGWVQLVTCQKKRVFGHFYMPYVLQHRRHSIIAVIYAMNEERTRRENIEIKFIGEHFGNDGDKRVFAYMKSVIHHLNREACASPVSEALPHESLIATRLMPYGDAWKMREAEFPGQ